jgi:hypothetical protein
MSAMPMSYSHCLNVRNLGTYLRSNILGLIHDPLSRHPYGRTILCIQQAPRYCNDGSHQNQVLYNDVTTM